MPIEKSVVLDALARSANAIEEDNFNEAIGLIDPILRNLRLNGTPTGGGVTTLFAIATRNSKYDSVVPESAWQKYVDELGRLDFYQRLVDLPSLQNGWSFVPRDFPHLTSHSALDPVLGQQLPPEEDRERSFQLFVDLQKSLILHSHATKFTLRFKGFQMNPAGMLVIKTTADDPLPEEIASIRRQNSYLTSGERYATATGAWGVLGRFVPTNDDYQLTNLGEFQNSAGKSLRFPFSQLCDDLVSAGFNEIVSTENEHTGDFLIAENEHFNCKVESLFLAFFKNREVRLDELIQLARIDLPDEAGGVINVKNLSDQISRIGKSNG